MELYKAGWVNKFIENKKLMNLFYEIFMAGKKAYCKQSNWIIIILCLKYFSQSLLSCMYVIFIVLKHKVYLDLIVLIFEIFNNVMTCMNFITSKTYHYK